MNVKIMAFDFDNTLAKSGWKISRRNALTLRNFVNKENGQLVILSGKPSSYLLGIAKQLGIEDTIVSGENGADIYFGVTLPPEKYIKFGLSEDETKELEIIKHDLKMLKYDFFYQPNIFSVTPFYKKNDFNAKEALNKYANHIKSKLMYVDVYIHDDCVDFTPRSINKGRALKKIISILNNGKFKNNKIKKKEVVVFGDSSNDIPMFELNYDNRFLLSEFDSVKGKRYPWLNQAIKGEIKGRFYNE